MADPGSSAGTGGGVSVSAERQTRILFEAVLAEHGERRRALLERARMDSPTVVAEVESLLEYHEHESGLLDEGARAAAERLSPVSLPMPAAIGRYTIVREIGHGGMGVVYEATQEFPKRRVALKVIRPELIGRSMTRRFEHEAEALAAVQHPAIAQLFEAGFESARMPDGSIQSSRVAFMAMELVHGRPLSEATAGLSIDGKVKLLALVCDAVDHAHRRGVIHRDLKPGNILVGENGLPKVLDFGIAKLTDRAAGSATLDTRVGQIVGTVGYMSPEQLEGKQGQVDFRSDVYSLGVLIYETLAGVPPIDVAGLSLAGAASAVRDREPTPLGRRVHALRGDLEAIAAHALEKNPDHRYSSAANLAEDLRRTLRHEPVSARPLTAFYHAGKFARRHRGTVASLAAIMILLVSGVVAFAWQAREARTQAADANSTLVFLTEMLQTATPEVAQGRNLTMREAVDRAEVMLEEATEMHPRVRAHLHQMLGHIYQSLYEQEKSLVHYQKLADLREGLFGVNSREGLHARMLTVWPMYAVGKKRDAWVLAQSMKERALRMLGPDDEVTVDLHSSLATTASVEYGLTRAEVLEIQQAAIARLEAHYGRESEEADRERMNHAVTLMSFENEAAAIPIMRDCLAWRSRTMGHEHPSVLVAMNNLGGVLCNSGEFDEGLRFLRETVKGSEHIWGPTNRSTIRRRNDLASSLFRAGKLEECESVLRRQIQFVSATEEPASEPALTAKGMLTGVLVAQKRFAEAEIELESLFRETSDSFGEGADQTMQVATLRFDLCEQRRDAPGMLRWAEFLKATRWGEEAMKQATAAAARFAAEDAAAKAK